MQKVLYVYDGKMSDVGIDAVVRRQLEALVGAGYAVDLVARGPAKIQGVNDHVYRRTLANLISWLPRRYYYGAQRRIITGKGQDLLKNGEYDLVIAWPQRALSVFRHASGRVPCLLNCDTLHFRARRRKERGSRWPEISAEEMDREYQDASLILVPSDYSRQTFVERGIENSKLLVIGRGINPERFSPTGAKSNLEPFRLVFCGRVTERKGIREMMAAWKLAALESAEFLIIGTIADDAKDLITQEEGSSFHFLHFQNEPENTLRKCDAQILLSRTEGMAKSLLEGAACGLATLATEESGFPLEEGVNGYRVERKDPVTVAVRLRQLYNDRALCQKLGEAGRATILANYTTEKFSTRFIEAVRLTIAAR